MNLTNFLIQRHKEWKDNNFPSEKFLLKSLVDEGQKPKAMIISCCDSRVDANKIFNTKAGEFFMHRNVANLIPPINKNESNCETLSSIEFALKSLKIPNIIILGHSGCGGINYAYKKFSKKKNDQNLFLDKWVEILEPAYIKINELNLNSEDEAIHLLEKTSIINSIYNLENYPFVSELILKNKLNIYGLWFEIISGNIECLNRKNNKFEKLNYL